MRVPRDCGQLIRRSDVSCVCFASLMTPDGRCAATEAFGASEPSDVAVPPVGGTPGRYVNHCEQPLDSRPEPPVLRVRVLQIYEFTVKTPPSWWVIMMVPLHIRHATELRDVGFTVVHAKIDLSLVQSARIEAQSALEELLVQIDASLGPPPETKYSDAAFSFREIVHRAKRRYDFPNDRLCFSKVCEQAIDIAITVITALHDLPLQPEDCDLRTSWARRALPCTPRCIMKGTVVSLPGATAQNFHADGSPMHFALAAKAPRFRLFQVFFPLVDIEKDGIGTQFWPCSHLSQREREFWWWKGNNDMLKADRKAMASMSAPAMPAGSIIIFDYRLVHRGLPNTGACARPIGHALVSTGLARDRQNYGRFPSVWDAEAAGRGTLHRSSDFAAPSGSRAFL